MLVSNLFTVSQLSVNDVISNCIATNGAVSNLGNNESVNNVNPLRPAASQVLTLIL